MIKYLKNPTLAGPQKVRIGKQIFGVPSNARPMHVSVGTGRRTHVVYVLTAEGRLTLLTPRGEVQLPRRLARLATAKYFPGESAEDA